MKPAVRNSVILFIILCLLIAYFVWKNASITRQIEETQKEYDVAQAKLAQFEGEETGDYLRIEYLKARYAFLNNWTLENSKFFLAEDNTRITWTYLQDIRNRFNPGFDFNFATVAKGSENEYNVSGFARIADLNSFVNYIEGLGALYTIENISLSGGLKETEFGPVNDINFNMALKPWVDAEKGKRLSETPLRRVTYNSLMKDPFRPGIYNPINDPTQDRFMSLDDLKFVSYTKEAAFFLNKTNHIVSLTSNQPVAYGYYSHVDELNQRAVFKINRTGLYDTVYKNLEEGK